MRQLIVHGHTNVGYELSQDSIDRLELAITLFKSGRYNKIILTGGLFSPLQNGVPISVAMKKYMVDRGIPEQVIETEPESLTTIHNVELLKKFVSDGDTVVTSDYHVFRTKLIWNLIGKKNVEVVGAKSTSNITPGKRIVELVGILVTIAYWLNIKFPEMIFRGANRKV